MDTDWKTYVADLAHALEATVAEIIENPERLPELELVRADLRMLSRRLRPTPTPVLRIVSPKETD